MSDWVSTFPGYKHVLSSGKKFFGRVIQTGPVPQHVGIIMDGNRRYARNHKIEIKEGHSMGFNTMANILELLYECGVKVATVYAFSIENFNRTSYEIKWLMDLAKSKFTQINQNGLLCEEYGVRIKLIGNLKLLPPDVLQILRETEEITKNNTRAVLNVCFPYTSRDEMTYAVKSIVSGSTRERIIVNEDTLARHLYTGSQPPLDLLVRTSGTYRLSDFLLWQCVSPDCAVVFVEKLWPEFRPLDMLKILINWSFNKYWYGNSSGHGLNPRTVREMERDADMELLSSTSHVGFERREFDDDDDEDTDVSSQLGTEEETMTSEDDVDAKVNTKLAQ
ncbi:Rer2 protein [Candida orthopsilosis Co 90-125]|uniref:Alkyl transferase n=1 Tax=Candida orthopsilosis (strain 90-125) TaxID=1136231 RepID=H8X8W1_CANO9|nr:Rer2 protein [Candida orthopsilosis Co 90-125]CCG24259.1 Rer2 protein [Candida orthopsilosis Co 90-125]